MHWLHVWSSKASQRWGVTVTEPGSRFFLDYGTGEESFSNSQVVEFTRDSGKHEAIDFRVDDPATLKGLDLSDNLLYGCIPEFTEFVSLESFIARGNHFTSYAPSASFPPGLSYIDLSGNSLTQRALDQMLADISVGLVALPPTGFVRIDGAHMPAPSAEGVIVLAKLEEKGWSTFTNDSAGWEWDIVSPAGLKSVRIGTKTGTLAWIDWAGAMDSLKSSGAPVTFSQTLAEGGMVRILVDEAKSLVSLNLAGNGFGGEVLPLNGLESLVTLDLQGNAFTGRVGSLPGSLEYLDLHSNAVSGWDSGPVPVGLTFMDLRENSLGQNSVDAILRDFAGTLPREDTGTLRLRKNAAPSVAGEGWADSLRDAGWTVEHDGDNVLSTNFAGSGAFAAPYPQNLFQSNDYPHSISFWIKTSSATSTNVLIGRYGVDFNYTCDMGVRLTGGKIESWLGMISNNNPNIKVQTTVAVNSGTWRHVVFTYDGSRSDTGAKLYVDGEDATIVTKSGTAANQVKLWGYFGISPSASVRLDEITVWGVDLSVSDVAELYNSGRPSGSAKLLRSGKRASAWWKMGDGDTLPVLFDHSTPDGATSTVLPTVPDESGGGFDSTGFSPESYAKGSVFSPNPLSGQGSCVYSLGREAVIFGNVLSKERTDAFTLSAWIRAGKKRGVASWAQAFGKCSYATAALRTGYSFGLNMQTNRPYFRLAGSSQAVHVTAPAASEVPEGEWAHLLVTYDGSSLASGVRMYLNGEEVATSLTSDNLTSQTTVGTSPLILGWPTDAGAAAYAYLVSHASVHSKALSSQEVAAIYNGGVPTDLRELSSASNLEAYWLAFNHIRNDLAVTAGLANISFVEDVP